MNISAENIASILRLRMSRAASGVGNNCGAAKSFTLVLVTEAEGGYVGSVESKFKVKGA
jgi:hypothetical protein